MDSSACAEFDAFARAHPDFQKEVDDVRPAFEWLDREFDVAGDTKFRLSPTRRAELRRASRSNVVPFPSDGGRGEQHRRSEAGDLRRKLSKWAAVAAVLVAGSYLGLAAGRDATKERISLDRLASVPPAAQPAGRFYVYPPAYGLDRSEPWRLRTRRAEAHGDPASAIDPAAQFSEWPDAQSAVYGLDGPQPYYEFSTAAGMGAI